ncbi:MAG: sulfatase-like hydrolase/transferase [Lachnospiraceae bacterium]|nr:sulfatase-like hydrolase/transferase [Lachnospiraceae bacterium]
MKEKFKTLLSIALIFIWFEVIYHFAGFGLTFMSPFMLIGISLIIATLISFVGGFKAVAGKVLLGIVLVISFGWHMVQLVYYNIFKQPLRLGAVFIQGQDALSNYWSVAVTGLLHCIPFILLMLVPIGVCIFLLIKKYIVFAENKNKGWLSDLITFSVGVVAITLFFVIGKYGKSDLYRDFADYTDPLTVAENMGVTPLFVRDVADVCGFSSVSDYSEKKNVSADSVYSGEARLGGNYTEEEADSFSPDNKGGNYSDAVSVGDSAQVGKNAQGAESDKPFNVLDIDTDALRNLCNNKEENWLCDRIESTQPTETNKFTGMFKDYNLIFLTLEGFSTYAIDEELTPTLYKMSHSSFVFNNYYVPLWQTSTSDGEYINSTGLIPDGQFSMRKSAENDMSFCLPGFFAKEGIKSFAFHDNSLSYYDRYKTHTNLGYDFYASKLGECDEARWGNNVFHMENEDAWPASDLDMMKATIPYYVNEDRFFVYYMTVSGHCNYDFKGNAMSGKNRELVTDLDMSENARAYLACNIELDRAMEYLLKELEDKGVLDKTLIVMSADHYPYCMTDAQYEELAHKKLSENMDLYRNTLFMWTSGLKRTIRVDKVCDSKDILPTLLNLFGFSYDSRLYAGRDIFSNEEGLVIFSNKSFISDTLIYDKKKKKKEWKKQVDNEDEYFDTISKEVKARYDFSAYMLRNNFYSLINQVLPENEKHFIFDYDNP